MTTGLGDMPRIAPNPSIWILAKGNLCAKVVILVLLGTLLLAGSAHAAASAAESTSEASPPASSAESAPEAPPAAESTSEASSATESAAESTSEASSAAESTSEASPPASSAESAPEAPPAGESTSEASPPEASPPASSAESAPEAQPPAPVADPAPEALPPAPVADPAPEASTPVEPRKEVKEEPAVGTGEGSQRKSPPPRLRRVRRRPILHRTRLRRKSRALWPGPSQRSPRLLLKRSRRARPDVAALTRTIAAQRAEDFTRELGGLGASSTDTYTAGFDSPSLISAAFVEELDMGTAARAGTHAGGRSGDSPGGSSPIGPPSEPTPSGTFGGAAGGGSGTALSGFPTFAGHLLLGRSAGDASPTTFVSAVAHGVLRSDSRAAGLAPPGRFTSAWTSWSRPRNQFEACLEGAVSDGTSSNDVYRKYQHTKRGQHDGTRGHAGRHSLRREYRLR